jgi:hypothetical protein
LIHEVAWAGTLASAYDEWIELHNTSATPIDLTGWYLVLGEDKKIGLLGTIPGYGFYLMERTNDSTVADIPADLIYTGGLNNGGDRLRLFDPSGGLVDSADYAGGWPAGEVISRFTMERLGGADIPGNWVTFSGSGGNGTDAQGNPIPGTPRQPNSIFAPTATPTATPTPTTTPAPNPYPPQSMLINEIAWAGTLASANDEWIELHNPGSEDIDLTGWTLTDGNDINIVLSGVLPSYSFYLLERSDDTSIADIAADRIYTGCLSNGGETLYLNDPTGSLVDSANLSGSGWPAGETSSRASMERRGGEDIPGNWGTFTGYHGVGHDADGNPIPGTPRTTNSLFFPTPVPTWIPSKVVINEVLIRPHYDWEGDGGMSTDDEFIEIYNRGPSTVNIRGWFLDDIPDGGSKPYELPSMKLHPGDFAVFFRSQTHIALNDTGDTVRLLAQNGRTINKIQYLKVRAYNLSYGRLPDGRKYLFYGLWPTPGGPNELFEEPTEEAYMPLNDIHMQLARLSRFPALVCWANALGYVSSPACLPKH